MTKETRLSILQNTAITLLSAIVGAFGMHMFVYPLNLAPIGVDGIATMLQYLTHINAGIFSILINLPLLIAAWFILKKSYVLYTLLNTAVFSGILMILDRVEFYQFSVENETVIALVCAGVMIGFRTGMMLRIRASSGGVDIVAAMCQKRLPHVRIESIITLLCCCIALVSYFVYHSIISVILSIILNVIFDFVVNYILRGNRNAVEITVITNHPEEIIAEIIADFKHGGYTVEGRGMFSGEEKTIISSVINKRQIPDFMKMCKRHPGTFSYYSTVEGVNGNFRWYREDEVK